jgi:hypothetical protein
MDFGWTLLHAADAECTAGGSVDQGLSGSGKRSERPRHLKSVANTIRGADLPLWNSRQVTPTSHPDKSHCAAASTASRRCRCKWTGPKPCDTPQNLSEQLAWVRHFGHRERHVLRVLCHLGSDLHQLLPPCCEPPVLHATGQRQPVQEVGKVIGQGEELQTSLVAPERAAGELRPLERVLALLWAEINRMEIVYVPRKSVDRLIGCLREITPLLILSVRLASRPLFFPPETPMPC